MQNKIIRIGLLNSHPRLVDKSFVNQLKKSGKVISLPDFNKMNIEQKVKVLSNIDIAITGWGSGLLPVELLKEKHTLKYICHLTGEIKKQIPLEYIKAGVKVSNWGSSFSFATAEGTIALLLATIKDIPNLDKVFRKKSNQEYVERAVMSLYTKKVGIYGFGFIGKLVAKMLKPFGSEISFYDPTITKHPPNLNQIKNLKTLFSKNDVIIVNAGLNDTTRNSINSKLLSGMKNGAVLINTARGGIVVEEDLVEVLNNGKIYAGIDVINNEAHWNRSPLAKCPNVILTGHVISHIGTLEREVIQNTTLQNITRFIGGKKIEHKITEQRYKIMT